nr:MAG TPA: YedF [Caudoviricetes sp.]
MIKQISIQNIETNEVLEFIADKPPFVIDTIDWDIDKANKYTKH